MNDRTRAGRLIAGDVYYLGDRRLIQGESYQFSVQEMNHLAGHPSFEFDPPETVAEQSDDAETSEEAAETSEAIEEEAANV